MDLGLKGLRAIVTGGSKGIGRGAADILAEEGAHVSICGRDAENVKSAVAGLNKKGIQGYGEAIDVGNKAALEGWVAESAKQLGGIDIVVANVSALAAAEDTEESWKAQFDIDMMHTVQDGECRLALSREIEMAVHRHRLIGVGTRDRFHQPRLWCVKAALIHYAGGLAHKLAPKKIRVNSVSPGNVYFAGGIWEYIEKNMPDLFAKALALNPTGRMATAEEIGRGIVFLASPASSFTMGTNLVIDGALTKGVQY